MAPNSLFLPPENCLTNQHLEKVVNWTQNQQMKLNNSKSKYMIFNFCNSRQFQTRIKISDTIIQQVNEAKFLGLILSDDLSWHSNTKNLVKKAYMRMSLLRKLYEFNLPKKQLVQIYTIFIRSVTEQSSIVWSSSISNEESNSLERTQKVALRIIFRQDYKSYENALNLAKLPTLASRRDNLLEKFALKTLKNPKTTHMIRKNDHTRKLRKQEKFYVDNARTTRLASSTINAMAHILNKINDK